MKLGGIDIHCIHAKWKGVVRQALVHGGRGWGRGVLAHLQKKEAVKRNFNLFHLYFTNEIRGDRHTRKMEGGGRTGALLQLTTDIATGFNQRKPPHRTVCVAVDLTAAFDTVCHNTLISKIARSTLPSPTTRWLPPW